MTPKRTFPISISVLLFIIFVYSNGFAAYDYGFQHIEEEGDGPVQLADGSIGEAQMSFSVLFENDLAKFTFKNSGPEASSITDIYFDDDVPLLSFASTAGENGTGFEYSENYDSTTKTGVEFTVGATPGDLPGGDTISFSSNYDYDSADPTQPTGVNPGELVSLYFQIQTGHTFDNLITALNDQSFRVGIKVQGFLSGGSESFVNNGPHEVVPEPATFLLFGIGLLGLGTIRKKKMQKSESRTRIAGGLK